MDARRIAELELLVAEMALFLLEKADWRTDDDKPGWSMLPAEQASWLEDDWLERAAPS
jgi:hypothetical protein